MTAAELKKLRDSTGLSQEKFGVLVLGGTTGRTVCFWEGGRQAIPRLVGDGIKQRVAEYLRKNKS